MLNKEEIVEIKSIVKEACEDMIDTGVDSLGIYNYIRYCNEDFGSDMYINEDIPITDNDELQHCYLIFVLYQLLTRNLKVSNDLTKLYSDNRNLYCIPFLESEINYLDKTLNL